MRLTMTTQHTEVALLELANISKPFCDISKAFLNQENALVCWDFYFFMASVRIKNRYLHSMLIN